MGIFVLGLFLLAIGIGGAFYFNQPLDFADDAMIWSGIAIALIVFGGGLTIAGIIKLIRK
jgi:NhaP-type Na+/H+ or K+/H+ antiporter